MRLLFKNSFYLSKETNKPIVNPFDSPHFARLENRQIIVLHGPDARKLLQGVVTNNVNTLFNSSEKNTQQSKISIYTLFLNPKGKIITDAIIFRPQIYKAGKKVLAQDQFWIDVASETCTDLVQHLKKYTWKKRVQLLNLAFEEDKPQIYAGFNKVVPASMEDSQEYLTSPGKMVQLSQSQQAKKQIPEDDGHANLAFIDPRDSRLGIRIYCGSTAFDYSGGKKSTEKQYNKVCRLNGISSSSVMVNKLPFMFNSDIFNGFSLNKGCYLGQQIVSRAYYTGIIRRRIFPFVLNEIDKQLQQGQVLVGQNKIELGKVMESGKGYGTVLCNYLPFLDKPWPLKIEQPAGLIKSPFALKLNHYIEDIKAKQARLQEIDL